VDAAFAARRAFGSLARIQEETRDAWGWSHLQRFFDDVRYGLRMLRKNPGWTAVISGTLTLRIGLTARYFHPGLHRSPANTALPRTRSPHGSVDHDYCAGSGTWGIAAVCQCRELDRVAS